MPLDLNSLVFGVFLPFLLFYVLIYALLRKSGILGKSKTIDILTAFSIAAIGTFSLYQMGLMYYAIWIATAAVLISFFALFVFSTFSYAGKKIESYSTGEAFKTKEEKEWDKALANAKELWQKFEKASNEGKTKEASAYFSQLSEQVKILEGLAPKLKKELRVELPWYSTFKAITQPRGEE